MKTRANLKTLLVMAVLLVGLATTIAVGDVIYVDDDADPCGDGLSWGMAYKYLQDALDDAVTDDEIWVAEGIYHPDANSSYPGGTDDRTATFQLINGVTIKGGYAGFGEPDPNARNANIYQTVLSGDLGEDDVGSVFDPSRNENSYHVVTSSGNDSNAVLDGFTITGGNADGALPENRGAGTLNDGGSPTVMNCTFCLNSAEVAGGLYNYEGNPTLNSCTFSSNLADWGGGGMANFFGSPLLTGCAFFGNLGSHNGSGIYNFRGNPVLTNCSFSENIQHDDGGGIYNYDSDMILIDCTFYQNVADSGGGIYNDSGSPMLLNCAFSGNSANYEGGGIWTEMEASTLTNCTFSGNWAPRGGGAYISFGRPMLTNCTFSGNSAYWQGGGIYNYWGDPMVINCILWGNSDYGGSDKSAQIDGSTVVIKYSCTQGGPFTGIGNISADPLFVDSDGANNMLGTEDDNLRLLPTSPCIDAADNNSVPDDSLDLDDDEDFNEPIPFDLDWNPRFDDDPCTPNTGNPPWAGAIVDMGAYEGPKQAFLVSAESVIVTEEAAETFTVALAKDPLGPVQVTVVHGSGDPDIIVKSGALLTFDSFNYWVPQTVTLSAMEDVDNLNGIALISISALGFYPAGVTATESDIDPVLAVIYVDANAPGINNGWSWPEAYTKLQDALGIARLFPEIVEEIRVAKGIYKPDDGIGIPPSDRRATFQLINGVTIKGGYAGFGEPDPNARDVELYETILSGDLKGDDIELPDPQDLWGEPTRVENSYTVVTGSGTDPNALLDGFTISGGNSDAWINPHSYGGGVYIDSGSPTIINCTITANSAAGYGGVYCYESSPMLNNCTISYNHHVGISFENDSTPTISNCIISHNSRGGIYCFEASLTISSSTISHNKADSGAGFFCRASSSTITNCTIRDNAADYRGGGLLVDSQYDPSSNPTITNCTITGNSAESYGGGIACRYANPRIDGCIVTHNLAGSYGGGIYGVNNSSPTVTNCDISHNSGGGLYKCYGPITNCTVSYNYRLPGVLFCDGPISNCRIFANSSSLGAGLYYCDGPITNCTISVNWASDRGGGLYNCDGPITNSTISYNVASNQGGGLYNCDGTIMNCILWNNIDSGGTGESAQIYGGTSTVASSCIQDDDPCDGYIPFGGIANGNIDDDPIFIREPDDGGDGWGVGDNDNFGDLHLLFTSPCIDAGDNSAVPPDTTDLDGDGNTTEPIPWDLDGRDRFADGDCNDTEIVDMGAYEFAWVYIGDFAGGCDVDFVDFSVLGLTWLLEEQEAGYDPNCDISLPADGVIDEKDLKIFTDNWLAGL